VEQHCSKVLTVQWRGCLQPGLRLAHRWIEP
jgi:hypothetical protein